MPDSMVAAPFPPAARRRVCLVLGMHRSGTSALTRALGVLGGSMPRTPLAPSPDNETGYWEPASIVALHHEILTSAGTCWDDPRPFPQDWFGGDAARACAQRLAALMEQEFGDAPLAVLKDPRLCRLLPLWRQVLRLLDVQPLYVLALRHPAEIAASLKTRDGMPPEQAMLLWLDHTLTAERETRGEVRAISHYDTLVRQPRASLAHLAQDLGLPPPAPDGDDAGLPSARYRHHRADPAEAPLDAWVERVYGALCGPDPLGAQAQAVLDGVGTELAAAHRYFLPLLPPPDPLAAERAAALEAQRQDNLDRLTQQAARQAQELERLRARCAQQDRIIGTLRRRPQQPPPLLQRIRERIACPPQLRHAAAVIRASGLFDADWYRRTYPDVAAAASDPLIHYLRFGAWEGRQPNEWFDSRTYLYLHPELVASRTCPLLHYLHSSDAP